MVNSSGTVLQSTDYYPFGLAFSDANVTNNRYLYNGKELENYTIGSSYLGTLDYGARHYDPRIGRWTVPDPMAEKYYGLSSFAYGNNNPILFVDKKGHFPEIFWDVANVILDVKSLVSNIQAGKVGASIVDGVGLVIDVAAAAFPFIPGGAGTAIKGIRAADKTVDALKAADMASDAAKTADSVSDAVKNVEIATDAAKSVGKEVTKELHRPYIRISTRKPVENAADRSAEGLFLDANTRTPIEGPYDLGHKYGYEYRTLKKEAEAKGLFQKEFNDLLNDPKLYQIENPYTNRSHKYEKK